MIDPELENARLFNDNLLISWYCTMALTIVTAVTNLYLLLLSAPGLKAKFRISIARGEFKVRRSSQDDAQCSITDCKVDSKDGCAIGQTLANRGASVSEGDQSSETPNINKTGLLNTVGNQ